MIESLTLWLLKTLSVPAVGLSSVFVVSFVSATLLPMGSEPAVFAVAKANSVLFWPIMVVATLGNTLGGVVDYWLGYGANQVFAHQHRSRWLGWLERFGPKTMLLAWVPLIGDPLCTLAGWAKLAFWPSVFYMALGKFVRYVIITGLLLYVPDGWWHRMAQWLG